MGFMLKVILLRSKHPLSASRFFLLSQEVKESMSYVKDPIGYFVTSQKNYFLVKVSKVLVQDQVNLAEKKSA